MASYTVTTTTEEEAALQWRLERVNADRSARGLPTVTDDQLVTRIMQDAFEPIRGAHLQDDLRRIAEAYQHADTATRDAVKSELDLDEEGVA